MAYQPPVAVIIPAHNVELWVADAIASVLAQGSGLETIVVDDGSTDQTAAAVRRFGGRVRYVYQPHRGAAAARNRGILSSGSELIAFLDADDFWLPGALERLVSCFDDPSVGLACGDSYRLTGAGPYTTSPSKWDQRKLPDGPQDYWRALLHWNFLSTSTTMIRRGVLERTGLFDEHLLSAHDYDLWLRIARTGVRFALIDQPLGVHRLRADSISADRERRLDAHRCIWEKLLRLEGLLEDERRLILANRRRTRLRYRPAAVSLLLTGRVDEARRCFGKASLFRPYDPRNLLGWALAACWPGAARRAALSGWLGRH